MTDSRQELAVPGAAKGTLIMTTRGMIPAEEVRTGDMVLTHTGAWQQVLGVRRGNGQTVTLTGGGRSLECTADQKILCRNEDGAIGSWTEAQAAQGMLWASPADIEPLPFPVPADRALLNENVFRIAGAYVAAGTMQDGQVHISVSSEAARVLQKAIVCVTKEWMIRETADGQADLRITSKGLNEWLQDCFGTADKAFPAWALGLPDTWRSALWAGLLDAGAYVGAHDTITVGAADMKAGLMILLLGQTLGLQGTVSRAEDGRCIIVMARRSKKEHAVWQVISDVSETGAAAPVFSFTVAKDGSFTANGIIVQGSPETESRTEITEAETVAVPA